MSAKRDGDEGMQVSRDILAFLLPDEAAPTAPARVYRIGERRLCAVSGMPIILGSANSSPTRRLGHGLLCAEKRQQALDQQLDCTVAGGFLFDLDGPLAGVIPFELDAGLEDKEGGGGEGDGDGVDVAVGRSGAPVAAWRTMIWIGSAKAGSRARRSSAARARSPSEAGGGLGLSKAAARAARRSGVGLRSGAAGRSRAWAIVFRMWMAEASSRVVMGWVRWGRPPVRLPARWFRVLVCPRGRRAGGTGGSSWYCVPFRVGRAPG